MLVISPVQDDPISVLPAPLPMFFDSLLFHFKFMLVVKHDGKSIYYVTDLIIKEKKVLRMRNTGKNNLLSDKCITLTNNRYYLN